MKPIETMRAFIEVRLSEKTHRRIIEGLAELHPRFEREGWKIRWVHPDNVHLTMRFLGDIQTTLVATLRDGLAPLGSIPSIRVVVKGMGGFPSLDSPRVLWVGLEDPEGKLAALAGRIDRELDGFGIRPDGKPLRPHVTIGRVVQKGGGSAAEIVGPLAGALFGDEEVREFVFMKSVLAREKAIHTPQWSVLLRHRPQPQEPEPESEPELEPEPKVL